MEMPTEQPHCFQQSGRRPKEKKPLDRQALDAGAARAFQLLRLQAEGRALELAARLRVIGKSLAVSCPGHGIVAPAKSVGAVTYQSLRWQLEGFLGSLADSEHAAQNALHDVRQALQQVLPKELHGCIGDETCRIERIETLVALLSDDCSENGDIAGIPALAFSL